MKTLKKITKTLIHGYIKGLKESSYMQYGYLYNK